MRWLTIAVAVAAFALVGAGCGGSDDDAASDTDTVVATDTFGDETTDDTTTDETDTDATETDTSGDFGSGDCADAVAAFTALSQAVAAAGSSGNDVEAAAGDFREFADDAPEEIRDDIRILGDAYVEYIAVLSDLGLEQGETPSADQIQQITEASEALTTPEVIAATESFTTWASTNCPGG
jgi:hypothetical protein